MTVMVGTKVSKMALKCPKIVANCLTSSQSWKRTYVKYHNLEFNAQGGGEAVMVDQVICTASSVYWPWLRNSTAYSS